MTEGDAIRKEICLNPSCDTVRLVYADWLDERGGRLNQWWAGYIRLAIAAKDCKAHTPWCGCPGCELRANEMAYLNSPWPTRDPRWQLAGDVHALRWERGFICRVVVPPEEMWWRLPLILRVWPVTSVAVPQRAFSLLGGRWAARGLPPEICPAGAFTTLAEAMNAASDRCVTFGRKVVFGG